MHMILVIRFPPLYPSHASGIWPERPTSGLVLVLFMALLTTGPASFMKFLIGLQEGAGIEDGKGNECVYSESNALATVTHHASPYYHHLRIQIHFSKWDEVKYEKLGVSPYCTYIYILFIN